MCVYGCINMNNNQASIFYNKKKTLKYIKHIPTCKLLINVREKKP